MKQITTIKGFTADAAPDGQPSICVYGEENTGKTKFGCTAPHDDGCIGLLALDRNSKRTVREQLSRNGRGNYIVVNEKPFLTNAEAIKLAMCEEVKETKRLAIEVVKRVWDHAVELAGHRDVESIVVDDGSQLFDWILFSHFGRRNQIESFMRGAPNNDFIELITAMGSKNLVMICRGTEVWADTGEIGADGKKKQAPTGKLKPEGFGKIGKFMTAVLELSASRKKQATDDRKEALDAKYRCKVVTCKGETLLEGQDLGAYGVCGESITWDNVMTVIKAGEY